MEMKKLMNLIAGAVVNALLGVGFGGPVGACSLFAVYLVRTGSMLSPQEPTYTLVFGTAIGFFAGVVPSLVLGSVIGAIYGYRHEILKPKIVLFIGMIAGIVGGLTGGILAGISTS